MEHKATIDAGTRVPIGWVAAGMALVFSLLPSLVTMKMLDERTRDLPETLRDHETRLVIIETRQGLLTSSTDHLAQGSGQSRATSLEAAPEAPALDQSAGTTEPLSPISDTIELLESAAAKITKTIIP